MTRMGEIRWIHCPGCGRRRERWPSDPGGLCVRCEARLVAGELSGDCSMHAELLVRQAHRYPGWHEFRAEPGSAAVAAAAIDRAAAQLYPGGQAEHEWEWDDRADRPTGRGRLRMRPAAWPAPVTPASALGAALAGDE
jgi:hypothetical protein